MGARHHYTDAYLSVDPIGRTFFNSLLLYGSMVVNAVVPLARIPGTVVNGGGFYRTDCYPPANLPVTCTHSEAKTGSWVDGLNIQWLCVP